MTGEAGEYMFRRRKDTASNKQNPCPFCEIDNPPDAKSCFQCYFEFEKPMRDQGSMPSEQEQNEVFDLLMSETETVNPDDDYAIEAVLSMDDVSVDVDQFEPTSFDEDTPEQFQFIESEGPTLNEVKEFKAQADEAIEESDVRPNAQSIEIAQFDPIESVPEPVQAQAGKLVGGSDVQSNDMDIDPNQIVGDIEIPQTPDEPKKISMMDAIAQEALQEERVTPPVIPDIKDDITPPAIPDLDENSVAPEIPELDEQSGEKSAAVTFNDGQQEEKSQAQILAPIIPDIADEDTGIVPPTIPDIDDENTEIAPPTIPNLDDPDAKITPPTIPEVDEDLAISPPEIPGIEVKAPAPIPQNPNFWPWAQREPWTNGQIDPILIDGFNSVKAGQLQKAAESLDQIGPHLGQNLDKMYHIGLLMKQVGRTEDLKIVLEQAQRLYPTDQRVKTAVEHLS